MVKKLIKHTTCRRRVLAADKFVTHGSKATATSTERRWKQTFKVSYIKQAFKRASVRESLQHGPENAPFLQRADAMRTTLGKLKTATKLEEVTPGEKRTMRQLVDELGEAAKRPRADEGN